MIRKEPDAAGGSPFLLEVLERAGTAAATLEAPDRESPFRSDEAIHDEAPAFESESRMEPAPTVDDQAAEPAFSDALRKRLFPLLDAASLAQAVSFNTAQHPRVSEIPLPDLGKRLELYVERDGVAKAMGGTPTPLQVCAQMAQQFQRKCFRETRFHTGKFDEPTLDALGFVRHRGRSLNAADRVNATAAGILRRALNRTLTQPLGTDVTAATWFWLMLDAPFLGLTTRWGTGIHLELMRRLRIAQRSLWTLPRYRDLSPVELGDALLWDPADDSLPHGTGWTQPANPNGQLGDRHRGARPDTAEASMHLAGLAVDLAYRANPWVGSLSFKKVSGRAASLVGGSVTDASGKRTRAAAAVGELSDAPGLGRRALHALAQGTRTTGQIYDALAQWNAWLEQYLALGASDTALAAAIAARQADGTSGIARAGDTPAKTLADWKRTIAKDLADLPRNSFSAAGTPRDPRKGFLSLHRDLVVALRDQACLAWGAVDLGAGDSGSGDMMHFDCRVQGIGRAYALASGRSNPPTRHPCIGAVQTQHEAGPMEEGEVKPVKAPAGLKGKLFRFESKEGGKSTAVFVPPAAMKAAPLTLLVWMHGLSKRNGKYICGNADDAFKHLADPTFSLPKLVEQSGRPFILVAPSMNWSGNSHKLATPKQMNLFLKEVEKSLEEVRVWLEANGHEGWTEKAPIGRLVLAGHSQAYVVLDGLACRVDDPVLPEDILLKLTDVWSLDGMYGVSGCASSRWPVWAALRPTVTFRVFYIRGTGTGPEGDRLERKAGMMGLDKKNLKVTGFATGDHCLLPSQQLPALLAGNQPSVVPKELEAFELDHAPPREEYQAPRKGGGTPPPPVVDPPGKTLYVDVPVHPQPVKSKVGVFIPENFRPTAIVDLVVFLHGHLGPCDSPRKTIAEFWNTGLAKPGAKKGKGPMALREALNGSGKNVILVVPSLGEFSSAGALIAPGGFDTLIAQALQVIRDEAHLKITPSLVRHIVLAGHSGGGAPMRDIVSLKDHAVGHIRRVWGFDSMNSNRDPAAWVKWAQAEPDPAKRRVYHYFAPTWADEKKKIKVGTWIRCETLAKLATDAGLRNVETIMGPGETHCTLPLAFLQKRIKESPFFDNIAQRPA